MTTRSPTPPPAASRDNRMLFLIGHGLQTPLSAIRWGCSRLKKLADGSLNAEQKRLLDGVNEQAKLLSHMMNALILVAKIEDGSYEAKPQDVYLSDFLASFTPLREVAPGREPVITCPEDLVLRIDRGAFEALMECAAVILRSAPDKSTPSVVVTIQGNMCSIDLLPIIELSFLRDAQDDANMVGAAPGLMLSVATSLSRFLSGAVAVRKVKEGYTFGILLPLSS